LRRRAGPTITYTYDADGNRTSQTSGGVTTTSTINDMDEVTQAGATTYGYDPDGNLITATAGGSTTTFTYNDQSQLAGVSGPVRNVRVPVRLAWKPVGRDGEPSADVVPRRPDGLGERGGAVWAGRV